MDSNRLSARTHDTGYYYVGTIFHLVDLLGAQSKGRTTSSDRCVSLDQASTGVLLPIRHHWENIAAVVIMSTPDQL